MARGVALPALDELPDGPRRRLVMELHRLYRRAGKPSVRAIAEGIKGDDRLAGTFSPDTVSKALRGTVVPSWPRLSALVTYLDGNAAVGTSPPLSDQLEQFHAWWLDATDDDRSPATTPAPEGDGTTALTYDVPDPASLLPARTSARESLQRVLAEASTPAGHTVGGSEGPGSAGPQLAPTEPLPPPSSRLSIFDDPESVAHRLHSSKPGVQLQALHAFDLGIWRDFTGNLEPRFPPQALADFLLRHNLEPRQAPKTRLPVTVQLAARILGRLPDLPTEPLRLAGLCLGGLPWDGARLGPVILEDATLPEASLIRADLKGAHFARARVEYGWLREAWLDDADFTRAVLLETDFGNASLVGCRFVFAEAPRAEFIGARALRANFQDARLQNAKFTAADLTLADFSRADLREATFKNANLTRVQFLGARLADCDFSGARIEPGQLSTEQIRVAKGLPRSLVE